MSGKIRKIELSKTSLNLSFKRLLIFIKALTAVEKIILPVLFRKIQGRLSIFLLLLIFCSACSSTRAVKKEITRTFSKAPAFENSFAGFALYDPEKKEMLYKYNAEKYFTPASNTKLFTFYTGLKLLGDSIPALKYVVVGDSLIFQGTGDPSFLHPKFPISKVYQFLKESNQDLYYAAPAFQEAPFGPGWAWDDYNWYYSAERSAFPIYGNVVRFRPSDTMDFPTVVPQYFQEKLINKGSSSAVVQRTRTDNIFIVPDSALRRDIQEVPFISSPKLLVQLLEDTLQRPVDLIKDFPTNSKPVKTLYGIPSDSLYKEMLQESDNFIAEQVLLMGAGKISDTLKAEIAIDFIKSHFLQDLPDEPIWKDGSGLSRYNLFTPRTMIMLLNKIWQEVEQDRLFQLLPASGESGTLAESYKAEKPYIFAKTGTLSNNHSLSGFLWTRKGKILIFSFMNSNYIVPTSFIKAKMEEVFKKIHENF